MSNLTQSDASASSSSLVRTIVLLGILLFVGAGWFWWRQVANSPRRVFYAMLENNMRTRGVTKHVTQTDTIQQLDQTLQLQTGEQNVVHAETVLSQDGGTEASVKTESIGTPYRDFVRYVDIRTDQTNQAGQPLDFSHVLNEWGASQEFQDASSTRGELFGEAVLGVIPAGFVPRAERQELLRFIQDRNIYDIDYAGVDKDIRNGRPVYTYNAQVNPEDYVAMLKMFGRSVGLKQLDAFDPASFRDSPPLEFELVVDVWSRQLTEAVFTGTTRSETYGSYGARIPVSLPEETIPIEDLQMRLQTIQ